MKTFDYIDRVNLTLPLSVYEGTWTHSPPLVAMHLLDRSCVIVGFFLKLHAMFPNSIIGEAPMEVVNPSMMVSRLDLVVLYSAVAGIDFR